MPNVELSPRADEDVRDIWRYTAETWSERQANAYVDSLFDVMEALAANADLGRPAGDIREGLRRQRCASHVIFYRPAPNGVFVVRVLHAGMDFAAHFANDEA